MKKPIDQILRENGYILTAEIPGQGMCGVCPMAFTWGLMVDCTEEGYESRYCYEHKEDAVIAISTWDGTGDPPGPWIKHKGLGTDRLGPGAKEEI